VFKIQNDSTTRSKNGKHFVYRRTTASYNMTAIFYCGRITRFKQFTTLTTPCMHVGSNQTYHITCHLIYTVGGVMNRRFCLMLNTTFNNISVILVEETGVPWENHQHVASHLQTLSHNVVSCTPRHERGSNTQI
jgi:hypothetical protein